jgi:hypothetical protein
MHRWRITPVQANSEFSTAAGPEKRPTGQKNRKYDLRPELSHR